MTMLSYCQYSTTCATAIYPFKNARRRSVAQFHKIQESELSLLLFQDEQARALPTQENLTSLRALIAY